MRCLNWYINIIFYYDGLQFGDTMIDLNIDMRQYDCPFIDTTDDVDVAFSAVQWQLDTSAEELETRLVVRGESQDSLEVGLHELRDHRNMRACSVLSKRDNVANISTTIQQTDAMKTIQQNGGYITGPFQIEDGSETWHVGFDTDEDEDTTLAELERNNEFEIEQREHFDATSLFDLLENSQSALHLMDGCRSLTDTERDTLRRASEQSYYETPRGTTLDDLASAFEISKTAVSMNLRRGEKKILESAIEAIDRLEDENLDDDSLGEEHLKN